MEAANCFTFIKSGNAETTDICVASAKTKLVNDGADNTQL